MLRIHDILVRIRIRGSIPLTNGSRSCYFCHWPSRRQQKLILKNVFLLVTLWRYIYVHFTFYIIFCIMIEGSGSKKPKNLRIRYWIVVPSTLSLYPRAHVFVTFFVVNILYGQTYPQWFLLLKLLCAGKCAQNTLRGIPYPSGGGDSTLYTRLCLVKSNRVSILPIQPFRIWTRQSVLLEGMTQSPLTLSLILIP